MLKPSESVAVADPNPVPPADTPADAPTVPVSLACNDEHGLFDSSCSALCVGLEFLGGPYLHLEGDAEDREELKLDARGFVLADCAVDFRKRGRHAGNVFWDEFDVPAGEAAKLLNHLRSLKHWQATVGSVELFEKWDGRDDHPYVAEDFAEDGGES